ncbi:MAG TPA: acyl carrier protein [Gemmatimonadales bacterium]|nr:acyl carrier protein [Gemmatimonadales bacterium]
MAVLSELTDILAGLGVEPELLTPDTRLRSDLGLTSTETTELGLEMTRRFGARIDLWDAADYSLAELADAISAERGAAGAERGAAGGERG